MTVTEALAPWRGFHAGAWQETVDVADFVRHNHEPYTGDASFLHRADAAHPRGVGPAAGDVPGGAARAACTTSTRPPRRRSPRTRPATSTGSDELIVGLQTDAPLQARDHAQRRPADGRRRRCRRTATSPTRACSRSSPSTARRTTTASSTPTRRTCCAARTLARHHRPARRLRPRPDHRRLPPGRAVRRRPADRAKRRTRKAALDDRRSHRRRHPRPRGAGRADPRARRAEGDGRRATASTSPARPATAREAVQWLYFAYLAAVKEQNGAAMSLGRTVDVPRRLLRARPRRRDARPRAGAGAHRRLRHQAADRPLPAHARVRRSCSPATRPGSPSRIGGMGDDGRPLVTRTSFRYPADALQPRPGAGAEPDRALVAAAARGVQAVLRPGVASTPAPSSTRATSSCGRAWGDDAAIACCVSPMRGRQADAVLRRPGQPRQGAAVRDQRRPRRDHRRAGRARRPRRSAATTLDYDDVAGRVRPDDGLARRRRTSTR